MKYFIVIVFVICLGLVGRMLYTKGQLDGYCHAGKILAPELYKRMEVQRSCN